MSAMPWKSQRLSPQPELQEVVDYLMWVLATERGCSGGAASAHNHQAMAPAPSQGSLDIDLTSGKLCCSNLKQSLAFK